MWRGIKMYASNEKKYLCLVLLCVGIAVSTFVMYNILFYETPPPHIELMQIYEKARPKWETNFSLPSYRTGFYRDTFIYRQFDQFGSGNFSENLPSCPVCGEMYYADTSDLCDGKFM